MNAPVLERGVSSGSAHRDYWEDRARRYAGQGAGLAAVCSYGMPGFYNRATELCQRLALRPRLRVPAGTSVLDVGCGVGRWSRLIAARGADVTGVDLSATMVAEATRRAEAEGLGARCRFRVRDLAELELGERFELVLTSSTRLGLSRPSRSLRPISPPRAGWCCSRPP